MKVKAPRVKGVTFSLQRERQRNRKKLNRMTKKLHERMSRAWDDAIRAFLDGVTNTIMPIHQDTGMSMGSLLPLARKVRMLTAIRHQIVKTAKDAKPDSWGIDGRYRPNVPRSVAQGEKEGEKANKILYGGPKRPKFVFEFRINVYQYFLHEYGHNKKKSWRTLKAGREAFYESYRASLKKVMKETKTDWSMSDG